MTKLILLILFLCAGFVMQSQNRVVQGEYYWDTDPGTGNGTALSASDGSFSNALENLFANGIDVSALSIGAHSFNVRVKGQDGTWSSVFKQTIYKDNPLSIITRNFKILQAEYYWDTDPGAGNGTPLLAVDGSFNSPLEQLIKNGVDISALSLGAHSFNVRVKGEDGTWSSVFKQTVYLDGALVSISRTVKLNLAEYFWDTDPGTGNGIPLLALDGSINSVLEHLLKNGVDISALPLGAHSFNVRVKGEDGTWSNVFKQTVYLDGPLVSISRTVKLNLAEYYWDTDPGAGNGIPLLALDGSINSVLEHLLKNGVDISALPLGAHSFNVRVKGEDGTWSSVFKQTVYLDGALVSISRSVKVMQAEYFWDTDPGTGSATPLLAFDGDFDSALENVFKNSISTSALSLGAHSFNVRVKGLDGTWSALFRQTIYVECSTPIPPTIAISTLSNGMCEGTTSSFQATATNAGTTPMYTWMVNGAAAGTNSPVFASSTLSNGDVITCNLQSNSSCASPNTASSNSIIVSLSPVVVPTISISSSEGTSICSGNTVTFSSTVTNEGTSPVYQWKINGNVVGNNSPTYSSSSISNGNVITCTLTSDQACATPAVISSSPLNMTVNTIVTPTVSISGDIGPIICEGSTVTFTANPVYEGTSPIYQWKKNGSAVGTNSSIFITSGLNTGDEITCEMTSSRVCLITPNAVSNTITITVLPIISTSITISSGGVTTICAGTDVSFTASPVNGGTSPSYQWRINGFGVGSDLPVYSSSSLVNGDVVSCSMTGSQACSSPATALSNTIAMTVNSSDAPTITVISNHGASICEGTEVTFSVSTTNGGNTPAYQWQINGSDVGTGLSYTTSVLNNGDLIGCILTSNAPCVSGQTANSNIINMNVSSFVTPSVSITALQSMPACNGDIIELNAFATNGGVSPNYLWMINGTNTGTNSPVFYASGWSNNDVVTCQMISNDACASPLAAESNQVTLTSVSVDASTTVVGYTITANQSGATYQWLDCDGPAYIAGAEDQSFTATQSGLYAVEITLGSCTVQSLCESIVITGIDNIENAGLNTYPNPVSDLLFVETSERIGSPVQVFDAYGKLVLQSVVDQNSAIDVSMIAPGSYYIKVTASGNVWYRKIVKID